MQRTPTKSQFEAALDVAREAALDSRRLRLRLGRRKTPRRASQLAATEERCAKAAEPLRSYLGMVAWEKHGISNKLEIRMKNAVAALRYERRQVAKMKR